MKFLTTGLALSSVIILLFCSFVFGPPFLNENNNIKQFGIELYMGIFSILWLSILWYKKEHFDIRLSLLDVIVILLLILYTCITIFSKHDPISHNLPFYYSVYYFMSKFVIQNMNNEYTDFLNKVFQIFVPIIIIAHVIIVICQIVGLIPPLNRSFTNGSTFGNPDMLGDYISVLLPFCIIQKEGWRKIGYFTFLISFFILIFIQARSAILATILCGFLWLLMNKLINLKMTIILSFFSIILLIILIFWNPESVYGRFFIWFISLKMIIAKPFGWGLYAFDKYYPECQASYLETNKNIINVITPDVVHSPYNEFLNIGVTLGVIGLLLFIILVTLVFYYAIKSKSQLIYPLFIFFIISLFYFPFKIAPLVALIVPMVAMVSSNSRIIYQKELTIISKRSLFFPLLILLLFLVFKSISSYIDFKKWQTAYLYSGKENGLTISERLFSELYPVIKEDGRFLITYSNLKYKQGCYVEALKLLEEAELYFCDITLSLKLARLYEKLGLYEKAEMKFDLAINIAPNNFTAPYEKILFLQNIGEYEKAYNASVQLVNKPIRGSTYADPIIIKSKLEKLIRNYEKREIE